MKTYFSEINIMLQINIVTNKIFKHLFLTISVNTDLKIILLPHKKQLCKEFKYDE